MKQKVLRMLMLVALCVVPWAVNGQSYQSVPYSTGFEGLATGALPTGWVQHQTSAGYDGVTFPCAYNYSGNARNGSVYFEFETHSGQSEVVAMPPMQNVSSLQLSFWASAQSAYLPVRFEVGVWDDSDQSFTPVDTITFITSTNWGSGYHEYTVYFSDYTGSGERIAMRATGSGSGQYTLMMDDFSVSEDNGCYPLSNLHSTAIDSDYITVAWSDEMNTGATYTVSYWKAGGDTTTVSGITATTYTATNLDASSVYFFSVSPNCTTGDAVPIAGSFRTGCGMMVVPFTDDFDSYSNGAWPPCWHRLRAYGTDPSVNQQFHHSGSQAMYLRSGGDTTLFVTPSKVPLAGNEIYVSFWAYMGYYSWSTYDMWIQAGVMTDTNDLSTFIALDSIGYHNFNYEFEEHEFNTSTLDPNAEYWVAWMFKNNYAYLYGAIDDVLIDEFNGCARPSTATTVSNIMPHGATLTWNAAAGATGYTVYYGTVNDPASSSLLTETTTDTTVTLTGLTSETQYYAWVVTDCAAGEQSPARAFAPFTTLISCPAVSDFVITDVTTDGATISWSANGEESSWWVVVDSTEIGMVYDTSYTASGFDPLTGHTLYVRAYCGAGDTSSVSSVNFATACDATYCNVVANMTDSYGDGWNGNAITFYQAGVQIASVTIASGNSAVDTVSVCSSAPLELRYVKGSYPNEMGGTIVDGGGQTIFTITGMNGHSNGEVLATATTPCPECLMPTNLVVSDITSSGATLTWSAPDDQSGWYVKLDSGDSVYVTDTTYLFTGLSARTAYTAYVAADCNGDISSWQSVEFITDCAAEVCEIVVETHDSYGDGWNGNAIEAYQNGALSGSATLASGSNGTDTIVVCSGIPVVLVFHQGSYSNEISFTIYDGGGAEIYTAATGDMNGLVTGAVLDTIAEACPTCIAPNGVMATYADSSQLNFVWNVNPDVLKYLISFNGGAYVVDNSGMHSEYGLLPNTVYTFSVKAVCTVGDTSSARTITVKTACGEMVIPYVEGFEGDAIGAVPSCWNVVVPGASGSPSVSTEAYTGNQALTMISSGTSMIASSAIPLPGDSIHVSFWALAYYSTLEAGVMTNPLFDTTFIPLVTITSGDYAHYEFNTSTLSHDSTYYLAFRHTGSYSYYNASIDDINISLDEGCMYPSNLVATPDTTLPMAVVTWTNTGSVSGFVVEHRASGASDWSNPVYVTGTAYTINSLSGATTFEVRVGLLCGTDTLWSYTSFTTACLPVDVPYFENFYSIDGTLPPCWDYQSPVGWNNWPYSSGNGELMFGGYSAGDPAVMPLFTAPLIKLQITFYVKCRPDSEGDGVMIGTADAAGNLLEWIDTLYDPNHSQASWVEHTYNFTNYTGSGVRIALGRKLDAASNLWAAFDSITVIALTDCLPPDSLTGHNLDDLENSTFSWVPQGPATTWQVYYDTVTVVVDDLDSLPASSFISVTDTFYTIPTGTITGGGIYNFFVRSNCDNVYSNWVKKEFGAGTIIMNNSSVADTVTGCGMVIYDNGGPVAGYLDYSSSALVIFSENSGMQLEVFGGKFGWGESSITLTIYDGVGSDSNDVLYSVSNTGTTNYTLDSVLATSTTGAMTITFTCSGNYVHTGYELYVHCVGTASCPKPTNLVVEMTGDGQAHAEWDATGASYYRVYHRLTGNTVWNMNPTTVNSYDFTGLPVDTTYEFYVIGLCSATDSSSPSSIRTFSTHYEAPFCEPVSNVTVSAIGQTTATVSWTSDGTLWEIELNGNVSSTSSNPYTFNNLTANTPYNVRVRNVCDADADFFSDWSDLVSFRTDTIPVDTTGIDIVDDQASVMLYPNPATASVTVDLSGFGRQPVVSVIDLNGRTCGEWKAESDKVVVDLTGFASGTYFVRVTGETATAVRKLVVK